MNVKMKKIYLKSERYLTLLLLCLVVGFYPEALAEESNAQIELNSFSHNYSWKSFEVNNDSLKSKDGQYLLKNVLKDGTVELIYLPCSETPEIVVVKPKSKTTDSDNSAPPTIFVVE